MLDFILEYWVQVAFSIIIFLFGCSWKAIKKIVAMEINRHDEELKNEIKNEIKDKFDEHQIQEEKQRGIVTNLQSDMKVITKGILSMQGNQFKEQCKMLLTPGHQITVIEFEQVTQDHEAYKELGGNHDGDALYDAVVEKYHKYIK